MMNARKEMSSAEQLVELRKARDRYKALADRFRDEGDAVATQFESESNPLIVMQEKLKNERDARRIANAYEKSIANIEASSSLMQKAQSSRPGVQSIAARVIVLVIFLIAATAAFLSAAYPGIYRQALAALPAGWQANRAATASAPAVNNIRVSTPPVAMTPPPAVETRQSKPPSSRSPITSSIPPKNQAAAKPAGTAKASVSATEDEGGFTALVLQPDGTLKERRFSVKPRR